MFRLLAPGTRTRRAGFPRLSEGHGFGGAAAMTHLLKVRIGIARELVHVCSPACARRPFSSPQIEFGAAEPAFGAGPCLLERDGSSRRQLVQGVGGDTEILGGLARGEPGA